MQFAFALHTFARMRINLGAQRNVAAERTYVKSRAAHDECALPTRVDVVDTCERIRDEACRGISLGRIEKSDEVMRYALALFRRRCGGADVHTAIDLARVRTDNFGIVAQGEFNRKLTLARCRLTREYQHRRCPARRRFHKRVLPLPDSRSHSCSVGTVNIMKLKKRTVFALTFGDIALPLGLLVSESVVTVILSRTTRLLAHIAVPDLALSLIGTAIGVLLAFRTNAAYARWWEARTLWGAITNGSRSLARQIVASGADAKQDSFIHEESLLLIAFVRALHTQLAATDTRAGFTAARALATIGIRTGAACRAGVINDVSALRIDTTLSELCNAQGGIERIASTPLPRTFDLFPQLFVYVYAALLPLALVDELGSAMPVVTMIVSFAFLVVNRIGTNLEAPFAPTPYRIPTHVLCDGIEQFVRQLLEQAPAETSSRSHAFKELGNL